VPFSDVGESVCIVDLWFAQELRSGGQLRCIGFYTQSPSAVNCAECGGSGDCGLLLLSLTTEESE